MNAKDGNRKSIPYQVYKEKAFLIKEGYIPNARHRIANDNGSQA